MKKDYNLIILGVTVLLILLLIDSFYMLKMKKENQQLKEKTKVVYKVKTKVVYKVKPVTVNKIDKQKFINWIYTHSFRCSRKQAEVIANNLLKTKFPLLFASIIKNESSFNITAYSSVKAIGLMQILPTQDHLKQLKQHKIIKEVRDLFNPSNNIEAGEYIFLDILKIKKNNIIDALNMYCGGSRKYVDKVLKTLGQLTIEVKND